MLKISHQASSLTNDLINNYISSKSNQIEIIFEANSGLSKTLRVNRAIFTKGCSSQIVADAAKGHQQSVKFTLPQELDNYFQNQSLIQTLIMSWIKYLANGELNFDMKHIGFYFVLACSFEAQKFFAYLIDQNVKLPIENDLFRRTLFKCCFDIYTNVLNQDGRHNFIWWMFRKNNYDWIHIIQKQFEDDIGIIQCFVQEYTHYKGENGLLSDDDVGQLISIYKNQGCSPDQAKLKVKKLINWEATPIQVLEANKIGLKFSENEIRAILQKRLNKLQRMQEQEDMDEDLLELIRTKEKLKQRYQSLVQKQGQQNLQMQLTKQGNYQQQSPLKQTQTKPKQFKQDNKKYEERRTQLQKNYDFYSQQEQQQYRASNNSNNYGNQSKNSTNRLKQQQQQRDQEQLDVQLAKIIHKGPPRKTKLQQPSINIQKSNAGQFNNSNMNNSYNSNNNNNSNKNQKINSRVQHFEYNRDCECRKSFTASCGCEVCFQCFNIVFITKTQNMSQFSSASKINIKPQDLKRYGVRCYICNEALNQRDVAAYHSVS